MKRKRTRTKKQCKQNQEINQKRKWAGKSGQWKKGGTEGKTSLLLRTHARALQFVSFLCEQIKTLWGGLLGKTCLPPCKNKAHRLRAGWESTSLWGTKPLWGWYVSVQSGKASHLRALLIPQILLAALYGVPPSGCCKACLFSFIVLKITSWNGSERFLCHFFNLTRRLSLPDVFFVVSAGLGGG